MLSEFPSNTFEGCGNSLKKDSYDQYKVLKVMLSEMSRFDILKSRYREDNAWHCFFATHFTDHRNDKNIPQLNLKY